MDKLAVVLLVLLQGSWASQAQATDCQKATTQTQMNYCAQANYETVDKKLNTVYQKVRARTSEPSQRRALTTAQLAWLKFRDAQCAFERWDYQGGSIAPTVYYACLGEITQQRVRQLSDYLSQIEVR